MLTSKRDRPLVYRGSARRIVFALTLDFRSPASDFFDTCSRDDQAKLFALFKRLGDFGRIESREKFRKLNEELWEFKSFQIRMPCAFKPEGLVVVTHGFIKKGDSTPPAEIRRAKRILEEDASVARIKK